jgi:hypothetical protein
MYVENKLKFLNLTNLQSESSEQILFFIHKTTPQQRQPNNGHAIASEGTDTLYYIDNIFVNI